MEYNKILSCVDIDEQTGKFHVEVKTGDRRGTTKILDDTIKKLTKFRARVIDDGLRNIVMDKLDLLNGVRIAIVYGEYFSTFGELWKTAHLSFDDDAYVNLFNRSNMSMPNEAGQGYQDTAVGAINPNNFVTENAEISRCSKSSTLSKTTEQLYKPAPKPAPKPTPLDIFGVVNTSAQLAHLMPHSPKCATLWYHFVPWVLYPLEGIMKIPGTEAEPVSVTLSRWNILQKCIHGFGSNPATERKAETNEDSKGIDGNANNGGSTEIGRKRQGKQTGQTSNRKRIKTNDESSMKTNDSKVNGSKNLIYSNDEAENKSSMHSPALSKEGTQRDNAQLRRRIRLVEKFLIPTPFCLLNCALSRCVPSFDIAGECTELSFSASSLL